MWLVCRSVGSLQRSRPPWRGAEEHSWVAPTVSNHRWRSDNTRLELQQLLPSQALMAYMHTHTFSWNTSTRVLKNNNSNPILLCADVFGSVHLSAHGCYLMSRFSFLVPKLKSVWNKKAEDFSPSPCLSPLAETCSVHYPFLIFLQQVVCLSVKRCILTCFLILSYLYSVCNKLYLSMYYHWIQLILFVNKVYI